MNYMKLVDFELKRFMKLFVVLTVVIAAVQLIAAAVSARRQKLYVADIMRMEGLTIEEYIMNYGSYTMTTYVNDGFFQLSVMAGFLIMLLYVFFIWYRDWLGKSAFMYRLLMLPFARIQIFFAKLTTIALFVALLVGIQKILLLLSEAIITAILPATLFEAENDVIFYSYDLLSLLYPQSIIQFIMIYGSGLAIVAALFTAILFERSFGLVGLIYAGLYTIIGIGLLIVPFYVSSVTEKLFEYELHLFIVVMALLSLLISIAISHYLLKRKITV